MKLVAMMPYTNDLLVKENCNLSLDESHPSGSTFSVNKLEVFGMWSL